jgi:hypothetical protein
VSDGLLDAALRYAARGWPCFPLVRKIPLARSHGYLDATLDPAELARLFAVRRVDGLGIATGAAGLLVVDLDGLEAVEAWRTLTEPHGPTAPMPVVRSPGGPERFHLYFDGSDPRARSTVRGVVGPMIETKAAGRYIVAPPSMHPCGGRYVWARWVWPLPEPPDWLLALTKPKDVSLPPAGERRELEPGSWATRYGAAALAGIIDEMRAAVPYDKEGAGLNDTLHRLACRCGRLAAAGQIDEDVARAELVDLAVALGHPERGALATWSSGFGYGVQYPARIEARR